MIMVTGDYPPYTSSKLENGGPVTQQILKIFEEMGQQTEISFRPWKRGYVEAARGDFQATFPYLKTTARLEDFYFSDPIVKWESHLYFNKIAPITVENLDQARECLPLHYAAVELTEKLYLMGKIQRERPAQIENCWSLLVKAKVDFFIEDQYVARSYLGRLSERDRDRIDMSPGPVHFDYGYILFPKSLPGSKALRDAFNQQFKKTAKISF